MNVLIYGAGAVGSYLGGRLAHANHQVTLITRPIPAKAINNVGLAIKDAGEDFTTRPTAVTSLRQALLDDQRYDVILLTMKAYDTNRALDEMVAFYADPPPLITLQNGIGVEQKFIDQYGTERVVAGSITIPISLDSTNNIHVERSDRGLGLAPTERRGDVKQWVELFETAGVATQSYKNYRTMKWSKAFVNIIANASSAIINRHPAIIYKNNLTFGLEISMLKEAQAVMRRLKLPIIDLPGAPASRLATALRWLPRGLIKPVLTPMVGAGRGDKMPSFHIDLANGKKQNEVVYHNGAIAEAGREKEVATPVNAALNDVLMGIVRGEVDWEEYSGQPRRLATEVARYRQR